jgi:hypothetical protein
VRNTTTLIYTVLLPILAVVLVSSYIYLFYVADTFTPNRGGDIIIAMAALLSFGVAALFRYAFNAPLEDYTFIKRGTRRFNDLMHHMQYNHDFVTEYVTWCNLTGEYYYDCPEGVYFGPELHILFDAAAESDCKVISL